MGRGRKRVVLEQVEAPRLFRVLTQSPAGHHHGREPQWFREIAAGGHAFIAEHSRFYMYHFTALIKDTNRRPYRPSVPLTLVVPGADSEDSQSRRLPE